MSNLDNQNDGLPVSDEVLSPGGQVFIPEIATAVSEQPTGSVPEVEIGTAPSNAGQAEPTDPEATDTSSEKNDAEQSAFDFPAREPLNNAVQEQPVFVPLGETWNEEAITLPLPSESTARVTDYMKKLPNLDPADTEAGKEWRDNLGEGLTHGVLNDFGAGATSRADAEFRQIIKGGGKQLCAARPKIGEDGPLLSGIRGVMQVNAMLGRGSIVQIPLWHSGFWVTIKAPTEGRLLEMWQRIAEEKILFGRQTHGLAFANHSVYMASAVIDLVMEHIYETTVKDVSIGELREMISTLDLNILAWGMACAIWPRGFQYSRSVLDPKGQEKSVIKEKLNIAYLLWTDNSALDEYQRSHMAQRATGSMGKIAIDTYKDHFTRGKPKTYALSDEVQMTLSVPNITQYLNMGQAWVNETTNMVSGAFTDEQDLQNRNRKILDQARATSLRQYRHWVSEFSFPTLGKQMTDLETITMQCNSLSGDDVLRPKFFKAIREYMDDSVVSVIATPLADSDEETNAKPRYPWLLQMDPVSTFFTLLDQKVYQIQTRP